MLVRDILAIKGSALYTIDSTGTLDRAVEIMNDEDVGSLVVFDHGHMIGMLTFREVLLGIAEAGNEWSRVPVARVMVGDPMRTSPEVEVDDLRREMVARHQRYIPVMEGEMLMGVVSFHDVAKAILEEQGFENRMLKSYIRDDWPAEVGPLS